MTYDQAQGARIGQRTSPENPGVRLCTVSELPEVAYRGQIIYLTDLDVFNVYDGDAWQSPGGSRTFVSADPPTGQEVGDLWVRSTDRTVFVWDGVQWTVVSVDPSGNILSPVNLGSGVYTGSLVTQGSVGNASSGRRVELNDQGLVQYADDGVTTEMIVSGVSGVTNRITGVGDFDTLSSEDTAFSGQVLLEQGSSLVLASAVNPPTTVSLAEIYPATDLAKTYEGDINGFWMPTAQDHKYVTTEEAVTGSYTKGRIYQDNAYYLWPAFVTNYGQTLSAFLPVSSTRITTDVGDRTVVLGEVAHSNSQPDLAIRAYDTSVMLSDGSVAPTLVTGDDYGDVTSNGVSYAVGRCFSSSGGGRKNQIVIGRYTHNTGSISLKRYNVTESTPAITATGTIRTITLPTTGGTLQGVAYGSSTAMQFAGANQDVFVIATTNGVYVYTDVGTPVRQTNLEFSRISIGTGGFTTLGDSSTNAFTKFWVWVAGNSGPGYNYSNVTWSGGNQQWWVGISWRDQTGAQETKPSGFFSIMAKQRAQLLVTAPTYPSPASGSRVATDAYGFVVYMGSGSTKPDRTAMWKQTTQPGDLAAYLLLNAYPVFSGTSNPLSTSTFTTGTAAKIAYPSSNVANFNGGDTGDVTVDANGDYFINHGMGVTPTHTSITPRGVYLPRIVSRSSTQIRVRFHSLTTGNALANGTGVRVEWQAWRMV